MQHINLVANDEERFYLFDVSDELTISEYLFSLDYSNKARLKGYDAYLRLTKVRSVVCESGIK
jgi:hypothetical protein